MFSIIEHGQIIIDKNSYLSFPDIIKGHNNNLFLVYRSANSHHPVYSSLHLLTSNDMGKSWSKQFHIPASLMKEGYVWNCPRLSYGYDNKLMIICDIKDHTDELKSNFNVVFVEILNGVSYQKPCLSGINGMVPDKFIGFKDKTICAVHRKDPIYGNLIQLIYWSRDSGKTFIDCNLLARVAGKDFCEASVVNYKDQIAFAYLRENSRQPQNIYMSFSNDIYHWNDPEPLPIYGHRVTAKYVGRNRIIGTFRNTQDMCVSMFRHVINMKNDIEVINIIEEKPENIYNFGYSGFVEIKPGVYFVVYYIKQDKEQPYIAYSIIEDK